MRIEAARNGQMIRTLYAEYVALERPSEAISTRSALGADVNALAVVQILTLSYLAQVLLRSRVSCCRAHLVMEIYETGTDLVVVARRDDGQRREAQWCINRKEGGLRCFMVVCRRG